MSTAMTKVLAALIASLITLSPAYAAQKTKAQLTTTITTQLPSTGQGQITATILRSVLQDMVDSDQQIGLINAQTGTTYTLLAGDQGKLVTFNNAAPVAVTLPQALGDFGNGYNLVIQNIGAGAVTVTPSVSTINGAASLVLNQNSISAIFSGSGNYRALTYGTMVSVTCGAGMSGGIITTTGTCSITDVISSGSTGTLGSTSIIPSFVYNSRGQITSVTTATISAGSLAPISNNTILSNISGGAAVPADNTWSAIADTITNQQGSILYRNASTWTALGPDILGKVLSTNGVGANPTWISVPGTGTMTSLSPGAGMTFSSNPITVSGTISADIASDSNMWSATGNKIVDASRLTSAGSLTTLTDAVTVASDFSTGVNFSLSIGGNRTLGNPTGTVSAGRTGCYFITQDLTGSRTLAYGTSWKFAGGAAPTLSTSGASVDALCYMVKTSSFIWGVLTKDIR